MSNQNSYWPRLKSRQLRALGAVVLLLCLPVLATAATNDVPQIQTVASDHARFFGYHLVLDGDDLRIRGQLRKSPVYPRSLLGHIEVQLLDADGRVLQAFDAPHRHFPSKKQRLRFSIDLPDPPAGLHTIRLTHAV